MILLKFGAHFLSKHFGNYQVTFEKVKTDSKKNILAQKYTNNKKSTILVQSPSNLVKMISPWVGNTTKVSVKLE